MSNFVLKELLQARSLVYQQVRFSRNRVNIQRPKPSSFEKEKFLQVTKPYYQQDDRPLLYKCKKSIEATPAKELSPLDRIYAAEVRQWFIESKLSAIFARNPMSVEDFHLIRVHLFKANMKLVVRHRGIITEALAGTEFANLLPLFDCHNMIAFAPDALPIKALFQLCKKEKRVSLLGAVVDNRILCVSELQALAEIQDIQIARSQLVQTIQSSAQNLYHGLVAHQNILMLHLQQRVEQLKEPESSKTEKSD